MSPNLRIALRFLTARKRAMLMSLSCIILGVGLFIVSQATTTGFQGFFIQTILGSDGAILIQDKIQPTLRRIEPEPGSGFAVSLNQEGVKFQQGIDEPGRLRAALEEFPSISGVSTVLRGSAEFESASRTDNGHIYGVDIDQHIKVSKLGSQIVEGSLDDFRYQPFSALIGQELARRLLVDVGDYIQIRAGDQLRRFRVSAIFETGVSAIDRDRVYLPMSEARSLLQKKLGEASYLQIQLFDPDRAPEEALHIQDALHYSAQPWQEREKSWLSAFGALRISSAITVSVFTLIAGLAMFNTLALMVIEKTKEIAILRSMGYERADITRIFLWQASLVLAIGAILGCGFGAAATYAISHVPIQITGIFATDHFIVTWSRWHYVEAIATAVLVVMVASLIPARRAARLEPGDIVRGTAQ